MKEMDGLILRNDGGTAYNKRASGFVPPALRIPRIRSALQIRSGRYRSLRAGKGGLISNCTLYKHNGVRKGGIRSNVSIHIQ